MRLVSENVEVPRFKGVLSHTTHNLLFELIFYSSILLILAVKYVKGQDI
jgi:hypothetical protein